VSCRLYGADIEVYFSPEDACEERICHELERAEESIDVMMYYFTSREIAEALTRAAKRDVGVRIILDSSQKELKYSRWGELQRADIPVHFFEGEGLLHHKVAVIDKAKILSGSFNWTISADKRNRENLILISDEKLARTFSDYFERLFGQTSPGPEKAALPASRRGPPPKGETADTFIASTHSNVFHRPACPYAKRIREENRVSYASRAEAHKAGKRLCKKCIQ
jgi:phosphatidylserine/phosphatidylglycerophosphate/cardiolipin synthase-like enzyme